MYSIQKFPGDINPNITYLMLGEIDVPEENQRSSEEGS